MPDVKRLKPQERGYCTYCNAAGTEKVPAVWRNWGNNRRACEAHKPDLDADEKRSREIDSHLTEADYQTWMRL